MNLAIIGTDNNPRIKPEGLNGLKHMIKIEGEYLTQRIIRIGHTNTITKILCIINTHELELKQYMSKSNFGVPLKLIEQNMVSTLHGLFALESILAKESFFLVNSNSVFLEREFSEFVTYSLLQEDADGVVAVTRQHNDERPLSVAMNDDDTILKFNTSKEGYSWVNGGIYYFSPQILKEINYALQSNISGIEQFLQLLIVRGYILKGFSFTKIINVENAADIDKAGDLVSVEKTLEI